MKPMSLMSLAGGAHVTHSVRLAEPLTSGGMGSLWVADHLGLRTRVIVKLLSKELAADPSVVERFSREASAATQLKSAHVVQMLDHGVAPTGEPFIVMEQLSGEDLSQRIDRVGKLPLADVATIVEQVASALGRAHERGLVHRDVKPSNVFLCDDGPTPIFVKVLDFGIAKDLGHRITVTGQMMGTPAFMSPEQTMGANEVDHRTDVWGLGAVAFTAMTGQKPFKGDTVGAVMLALHGSPLPRPSAIDPELSPEIDAWFARACAKDPEARFDSVREMAQALRALITDVPAPIVREPTPIVSEPPPPAPASPWPKIAIGVAVASVIGTIAFLALRTGDARPASAPKPEPTASMRPATPSAVPTLVTATPIASASAPVVAVTHAPPKPVIKSNPVTSASAPPPPVAPKPSNGPKEFDDIK